MLVEWRLIPSNHGYEASSSGEIRRVKVIRGKPPSILRPWPNSMGYAVVGLRAEGRTIHALVHRMVCEAFHGPALATGMCADHVDRDFHNNSAANLRWSTHSQNMANSKTRVGFFRGVSKKGKRWAAFGSADAKTMYLGTFDTPEKAALAYDDFASVRYGKFAVLNFPDKFRAVA